MTRDLDRQKWARLVDDDFLLETGLSVLCVEVFDGLIEKGWAVRNDLPDGEAAIDWTPLGASNVPDGIAYLVDALRCKVVELPQRRQREGWSA